MNAPLKLVASNHAILRDRLREQFALTDDEQTLTDTLDGISDFKEMCAEAIREAKRRLAMAEAMDTIIDDNTARRARHEAAAKAIRATVLHAMQEAGERKIEAPDLTVTVAAGRRRLIIDDERLPHNYQKQIIKFVPDREKIEAAIGEGDVPIGVQIDNGTPVLKVSTK